MSVDGKISTGSTDELDMDRDLPGIADRWKIADNKQGTVGPGGSEIGGLFCFGRFLHQTEI